VTESSEAPSFCDTVSHITLLGDPSIELKLPRRNSFVLGFTSALAIFIVVFVWNGFHWIGGIHEDSPDGLFALSITAPLSPTAGDSYTIKLTDKKMSAVVCHLVVTVPRSERTTSVRGGSGAILWDSKNMFADFSVHGSNIIRVWIP